MTRGTSKDGWRPWLGRAMVLSLLAALAPAFAADNTAEREQLAALVRQIDLLDRLAEHAAVLSPSERARYHFDHARLREDIGRIRAGLRDYLTPQRAQPRDPVVLTGDYRRVHSDAEPVP